MTAAELITALQAVPPDTQIRLWTDHGQLMMLATTCGLQPVMKSELTDHIIEDAVDRDLIGADPEDEDDAVSPDDVAYVFEIGSP